jgi:hypothetical protein
LGLVASTLLHQHGDWQTCDFSTNLKQTQQWGRLFIIYPMEKYLYNNSVQYTVPKDNYFVMKEWYHEEVNWNPGHILNAKLWNVVYWSECCVSLGATSMFAVQKSIILFF